VIPAPLSSKVFAVQAVSSTLSQTAIAEHDEFGKVSYLDCIYVLA
jgi:hypothetical protein